MKYLNKTSGSTRLAALLFGAALFGLISQNASALTSSGTSISNSATLSYSVATIAQTNITSTAATFLVDEKINLTVTGGSNTNVLPGATAQVTTFTVTNNSNSPLDFGLAVTTPGTVNFAPTGCAAYGDNDSSGTYVAASDTKTYIDELPAGSSRLVFVVCSIPVARVNGDVADVGLVATAEGNFSGANGIYVATLGSEYTAVPLVETAGADTPGTVDLVFADDASGSPGVDDISNPAPASHGAGIRNAAASARDTYTVVVTVPLVVKTATVLCDPINGVTNPKNIPGAMTQWSITVTNPATNPNNVTLTTIADALDTANLTLDLGTAASGLTVPTNAATCVAGAGDQGFNVTVPAARNLGGSLGGSGTSSNFTTTTADGVIFATPNVTATFATILPIDGAHGTAAGELLPGDSVTLIFNTLVK